MNLPLQRIVVAGATGFLGSAIVDCFAAEGATVLGLARRASPQPGPQGVSHVSADLRDTERLAQILAEFNPDAVINAAGRVPRAPGDDSWALFTGAEAQAKER